MNTFKTTIKDLAAEINQDYQTTSALVKILLSVGAAKEAGKQTLPAGTRGKPSSIYELDYEFEMVFREDESEVNPVDSVNTDEIMVDNRPEKN